MEDVYFTIAAVVISAVLSVEAYKLRCLTKDGAIASFFVGSFVGVLASLNAFFHLAIGTGATLRRSTPFGFRTPETRTSNFPRR